jgi:hypothetical protein
VFSLLKGPWKLYAAYYNYPASWEPDPPFGYVFAQDEFKARDMALEFGKARAKDWGAFVPTKSKDVFVEEVREEQFLMPKGAMANMTSEQFLDIVSLHVETWRPKIESDERNGRWDRWHCGRSQLVPRRGKELKDISLDDWLYVAWTSGGVGGGSCWDDSDHYPIAGEPEPEFTDLDVVLEHVCPQITLLQYRQLLSGAKPELVQYEDWSKCEYYGNSTDYRAKMVSLRRLFERLGALGLV